MFSALFAAAAISVASWAAGRAHLKATVLKPINAAAHLPAGTIESKINAAVELSAQAAAQQGAKALSDLVDKRLGA